ncbi:MAG: hypothetical protein WAL83_06620 [Arenicellales bacterium]
MKNNLPQSEKFDSLRAGLHVEGVDFKDTGTPKLINRENAYWQRILDCLDEGNNNRALCNQLRIRRRQVLSGQYTRGRGTGLPRFTVATAAGVVVLAAVTAWLYPVAKAPESGITQTASLNINGTDFSNNIDFYTWLEKQSDTVADSGGN